MFRFYESMFLFFLKSQYFNFFFLHLLDDKITTNLFRFVFIFNKYITVLRYMFNLFRDYSRSSKLFCQIIVAVEMTGNDVYMFRRPSQKQQRQVSSIILSFMKLDSNSSWCTWLGHWVAVHFSDKRRVWKWLSIKLAEVVQLFQMDSV